MARHGCSEVSHGGRLYNSVATWHASVSSHHYHTTGWLYDPGYNNEPSSRSHSYRHGHLEPLEPRNISPGFVPALLPISFEMICGVVLTSVTMAGNAKGSTSSTRILISSYAPYVQTNRKPSFMSNRLTEIVTSSIGGGMSLCPDSREELHGDRGSSYVVCGTDTMYDNIGLSNEQFDAVRADESTTFRLLG
ncbi:hypothetical protein KCU62_g159, partial [Aureobasidium sp. EXF-3399]